MTLHLSSTVSSDGLMDDMCNIVFLRFHDVTKQNCCISMGSLYREPLAVHNDNAYKLKKGRGEIYKVKLNP